MEIQRDFKPISIHNAFFKIFTKEIIEYITEESNKYAVFILESIQNKSHPNKKLKHFRIEEITSEEMSTFLGLIMLMGVIKLPSLKDYWSEDPFIATIPFRLYMTRDRFLYILRFLHVCDPRKPDENNDPVYKIRLFSNTIKNNFQKHAELNKQLTVDEIIIPSKGRCKFRQHIKSKRHRFGMKVWALCDSITSYIFNFDFYTGKNDKMGSKNLSEKVVLNLLKDLKSTSYSLYMDAYFTSVPLFDKLNDMGYGVTGVLKHNRKFLPSGINKKMNKNDIISFYCGNMLCFSWIDNKPVYILTNNHTNEFFTVSKSFKSDINNYNNNYNNYTKIQNKPQAILKYNQYAHGVDRADQLMAYYKYNHKTVKVWKRIFFFLLEASIINSFVLYKTGHKTRIEGRKFRLELAKSILDFERRNTKITKTLSFTSSLFNLRRIKETHSLIKNINYKMQDCYFCSSRKKYHRRTRTKYMCQQCTRPMCGDCFKKHHTEKY